MLEVSFFNRLEKPVGFPKKSAGGEVGYPPLFFRPAYNLRRVRSGSGRSDHQGCGGRVSSVTMISLDWTLIAGGLVFLLTLLLLDRLLFQPLMRVMDERQTRTSGMMAGAEQALQRHEELLNQLQEKIRQEKSSGYQLAESVRRQSLAEQRELVAQARARAQERLQKARQEIEKEAEGAREKLQGEVSKIADQISSRILDAPRL